MPPEPKTKQELLHIIQDERHKLETALAKMSADQMTTAVIDHDWTVKDILAHIVAWEQLMIGWLTEIQRGDIPSPPIPATNQAVDAINLEVYQRNKERPLAAVWAEFATSYQQALAAIAPFDDRQLFDPDFYPWRQKRPLLFLVGGNTGWHYYEHHETIARWLNEQ